MPSADFAAAQHRIAARRALRARKLPTSSTTTPTPSRIPLHHSLSAIWNSISGREGTNPSFRVGQVDAELLDDELLSLLKTQVGEALKYFGQNVTDSWSAEILLALRVVLWKLSVWNNNTCYGAHLQGLRFTDARSTAPDRPPPSKAQKLAYGAVMCVGRYAWTKWEAYLLSAQEDYTRAPSEALVGAGRITEWLDSAHDVASLASFLVFLVNGRYRTLTDRILRMRLTPASHETSREVSFEYLNRQLVWHAFTEFLLFLLPLVGISRWRRILARTFKKVKASVLTLLGRSPASSSSPDDEDEKKGQGELSFLPERTCAICYRDQNPTTATEADVLSQSAGGGGVVGSAATDITNPYETVPCGCVYCFACLAQRIANEEGEGWTCLRCGEIVKECRPWDGDVLEPSHPHSHSQPRSQSFSQANAKSVGFAALDGGDEKAALRDVDPMPEAEDGDASEDSYEQSSRPRGMDWAHSLDESAEWARARDERSSDEDSHSEEYDEDEQEEGEELDYDM